jgi:glucose-1-phosphate cytidylyltransferase
MKAVILAGGYGTRISEQSAVRPKPMVEVGEHPLLWHIMKIYSAHGVADLVICCGYKGWMIKDFFASYAQRFSDTFDFREDVTVTSNTLEPWRVTLADIGEKTMTGARLRRVGEYVGGETFCFTYGDAVSDIDIGELVRFIVSAACWRRSRRFNLWAVRSLAAPRERGHRRELPGEAVRRRRLDQRRVRCARAGGDRLR